ncbi:unnamed protein product [Camellia sinensis]
MNIEQIKQMKKDLTNAFHQLNYKSFFVIHTINYDSCPHTHHKSFNPQDLMQKKPCNTVVCVLSSTCSFPFLERNLPDFGHTNKMTSTTEVPCPKRPVMLYLKIPAATRILCMIVRLRMHWNNIREF